MQPGTFEVRQIDAGDLDVGYVDSGPADGPAVLVAFAGAVVEVGFVLNEGRDLQLRVEIGS